MIYDTLQKMGIPVRYNHFTAPQNPPYMVWRGDGQYQFRADDTTTYKTDNYVVEYVFEMKDPDFEERLENQLLEDGFRYEKSEDTYIDDEDVFSIYYYIN